jgi:hypothetical protein
MRGSLRIVLQLIPPWILNGTNGDESVASFGVSNGLNATHEVWIERLFVLIDFMGNLDSDRRFATHAVEV